MEAVVKKSNPTAQKKTPYPLMPAASTPTVEDKLYRVESRLKFVRAYLEARSLLGPEFSDGGEFQTTIEELLDASVKDIGFLTSSCPFEVLNHRPEGGSR
jgi:hypothetical protein